MHEHGPWKIISSRQVYRDPWIVLTRDQVIRPDGTPGSHCVVRMKAGVSVLAVDDQRQAWLTEEFHYGIGREAIEVVSGGIEPDEEPLETARRELREELGIDAADWLDLGSVDPFTTIVVSPTRLYLARRLTFGPVAPEATERIRSRRIPFDELLRMVYDGRITHGPSCVLILKAALALDGRL